MNNRPILYKFRYFWLFLAVLFFTLIINTSPANAQGYSNGDCLGGGTSGLGGPNIPDLPSAGFPDGDGCVNEVDLAVLLHCWGSTLAEPSYPDCLVDAVALFNVTISPSPDNLFQGANRSYEVKADGGIEVPAGMVTFSIDQCPSGATCTFIPPTTNFCNMPEAGDCSVTLNVNGGTLALGQYQVVVRGDHNDGLSNDGILDLTITPTPNTFVTSGSHSGNFYDINEPFGSAWVESFNADCGGIVLAPNSAWEVANCICSHYANLSNSVVLPGEYHAWLSSVTSGSPACSRSTALHAIYNITYDADPLPNTVLVRTDGAIIASNRNALTETAATPLQNPINRDESGGLVTGRAWTGTNAAGECAHSFCVNAGTSYSGFKWYEGTTSHNGLYGNVSQTGFGWTDGGTAQCNQSNHLYCVYYDSEIPTDWANLP